MVNPFLPQDALSLPGRNEVILGTAAVCVNPRTARPRIAAPAADLVRAGRVSYATTGETPEDTMNTRRWATANSPHLMLNTVYARWGAQAAKDEPYDRERLRLFACACCRRLWHLLDEDHRRAVALLEEHARSPSAGLLREVRMTLRASSKQIEKDWHALNRYDNVVLPEVETQAQTHARYWASQAVGRSATRPSSAAQAYGIACRAAGYHDLWQQIHDGRLQLRRVTYDSRVFSLAEAAVQADLLRDIIGDPYRRATASSSWLAWNDGTVRKLAQSTDEGAFDRLPILADALEEAGCTDEEILAHCRGPGPHVKGCWVVDLLQGRN
jgi:hypothetical protein